MSAKTLYVGLMSGTSLDGIDAAVVDFAAAGPALVLASLTEFSPELRQSLLALQQSADDEIHRSHLAGNALAQAYADATITLLERANLQAEDIKAIGMHGQTIRHRPELGYTVQIGNAALLAELTGVPVVSDFRSRDIAAGGQGAPLVPAFHRAVFGSNVHRAIVNIGGISNITDLLPCDGEPDNSLVRGWDTGPGNVLLDGWIERHLGKPYDEDGEWAASGLPDAELLNHLLGHPFLQANLPKSTGRDHFNMQWIDTTPRIGLLNPADVQATLLELTAQSISRDLVRHCGTAREIYVCGGGARNSRLMARLAKHLSDRTVRTTEVLGIHPDWVEAMAFAWLAKCCIERHPSNLPDVTGARGARVLGGYYPA